MRSYDNGKDNVGMIGRSRKAGEKSDQMARLHESRF